MKRLIGSGTRIVTISLCLGLLPACTQVPKDIEPKIHTNVQDRYLKQLPSPFPELTLEESETRWGAEYLIGMAFAKDLDLYQAITAFKRALILAPEEEKESRLELDYEIILAYYLGRRFEEAAQTFKDSPLAKVSPEFPAFHDLLIILYDIYEQSKDQDQAKQILGIIKQYYPKDYEALLLSSALQKADFTLIPEHLLKKYEKQKKSPTKAATFNALLPGAGYLYIGQKQTALTALLINALFIAAIIFFFRRKAIAAAIIFLSFEAGWYFGGIHGGATEAKFYNERLYEKIATPYMQKEGLFPVYRLKNGF